MSKIKLLHVGLSGIPLVRSAAVSRCLALYKVLSKDEFDIRIINNKPLAKAPDDSEVHKTGVFKNMTYVFTPPILVKPDSFIKRRYNNFMSRVRELVLIAKSGLTKKVDLLMYYPSGSDFDFFNLLLLRFMSKIFGFKIVSQYVEFRSEFYDRGNTITRLNDRLFDRYFMNLVDGVIPISEFLITHIKARNAKVPILKIPPLVDFTLFEGLKKEPAFKYFLFVGNTGHYKPIDIILEAFEQIKSKEYHLVLILHGDKKRILELIDKHPNKDLIQVLSNLDYSDLLRYNKNAQAMLIPLNNSIKDIARSPNKMSEYLASANPLITSNYGEVSYYFKDEVNALVAPDDSPGAIAEKMKFVIQNPEKAIAIGKEGYKIGTWYFDSNSYSESLSNFLKDLLK